MLPKIKALIEKDVKRVDILATLCTRLTNYVAYQKVTLDTLAINNIKAFMKMELIPDDMRLAMAQELTRSSKRNLKKVFNDSELSILLLGA